MTKRKKGPKRQPVGRCIKWSKGRKRCLKRAPKRPDRRRRLDTRSNKAWYAEYEARRSGETNEPLRSTRGARKGRCKRWSKGRTRCLKRG